MIEKNQQAGRLKLDYIIIETNGLADPCQLVQTFWLDDYLMSKVSFHSCICLIDSSNFLQKLSVAETKEKADYPENELLVRQLVYADKLLLNKCDLASAEQIT
jgi:G3E family GTPase